MSKQKQEQKYYNDEIELAVDEENEGYEADMGDNKSEAPADDRNLDENSESDSNDELVSLLSNDGSDEDLEIESIDAWDNEETSEASSEEGIELKSESDVEESDHDDWEIIEAPEAKHAEQNLESVASLLGSSGLFSEHRRLLLEIELDRPITSSDGLNR